MKHGAGISGNYWFLVDNERVGFINDFDGGGVIGQGSATIILKLRVGQLVRIENSMSPVVFGYFPPNYGYVSWFTGFLLHALE